MKRTKISLVMQCLTYLVLILAGSWAIAQEFGMGEGVYNPVAWQYFTDLSNMAAIAYFTISFAAILLANRTNSGRAHKKVRPGSNPLAPRLKHTIVMALVFTFLVSNAMLLTGLAQGNYASLIGNLRPQEAGRLVIMHYVVPLCALTDWFAFEPKGQMRAYEPLVWAGAPLAYFVYVFVCVHVLGQSMGEGFISSGNYPYPFLDVDLLGWTGVLTSCLGLLAVFILVGYGWLWLDTYPGRRQRGPAQVEVAAAQGEPSPVRSKNDSAG